MKKIGNAFALGWLIIVSQVTYSLADAQGLKIMDNTGGKPWNLTESPSAITLGRKHGEGGYGAVYLSQYNGTQVAVKKLKLDKKADTNHMNKTKTLR